MFLPSNITLQFGDSGDFVAELQRRLVLVNCFNEAMVNGFYDGPTVNGVTLFQSQCGLRADGVAGPETLRRLNGYISGDTSTFTSSEAQAEETQYYAAAPLLNAEIVAQHELEAQQQAAFSPAPEPVAPAPAYVPPAPEPVAPAYAPPPEAAYQPPPIAQQLQQAEMVAEQQRMQQFAQSSMPSPTQGSDALASLLAGANAAPPIPQNVPPQAAPQPFMPPSVAAAQPSQPPLAPTPPAPTAPPGLAEAAAPAAPGLLQRALNTANAFVQKLASYFEAKLPPDTLREVQQIGEVMARSGVRETPIPADPTTARAPELPTRAPAQAQTQQR